MTNPVQPIISANRTITIDRLLARLQKEREIPVILTKADYAEAVKLLVKLAQTDCGGARVAAQVLLSAYNGNNWQCNLVDLCNLDAAHYRAAIIVIRSRVELNSEPQRLIANGDAIFDRLEEDWQSYHVKNRK
jgi:hypothetical protein